MRMQLVNPQKTIECGICKSKGEWLKRINIEGVSGLYCFKCDTLTTFEPFYSQSLYNAFKQEIDELKKL